MVVFKFSQGCSSRLSDSKNKVQILWLHNSHSNSILCMRTFHAVKPTKKALDFESEGQVSSSQPILIRLSPQVTNGLSKSPVLPSFQIQQCILILILFNISIAADTVDPSFHETPFALPSGPTPHMLCFLPPSLALPFSPLLGPPLLPDIVCWHAPQLNPRFLVSLCYLIQSHGFKGSLHTDDSHILSSNPTFLLFKISNPTCPKWNSKLFPLNLPHF